MTIWAKLLDYVRRAVDPRDDSADAIYLYTTVAIAAFVFFQGWDVIVNAHELNGLGFGGGIGGMLTGAGLAKMARDNIGKPPATGAK